jgi:NitT/TauT family transport system substrate-binding protein
MTGAAESGGVFMKPVSSRFLIAATCAAVLGIASSAAHAQVKIRVGSGLVPVHLAPLIFKDDKITRHMGKSYTVEFISFRGSSHQLTALASNEVDIAAFSVSSFAAGIQNASLELVALADIMRDGPEFSGVYAVLDPGPIRTIADLKGRAVAINARGGTQDMTVRKQLLSNGLNPDRDVQIVEMPFTAMEAALRDGKVALSPFSSGPWSNATKKGGVRALFHERDAGGTKQFIFYGARPDFVRKNRAALVDWLEDYVRGINWLHDPANRAEALKIVAAVTKRPAPSFADWVFLKGNDYFHDPKARLDVAAFQSNLNDLKEFGIIKETFDVRKYVDESLVIEAARRLTPR